MKAHRERKCSNACNRSEGGHSQGKGRPFLQEAAPETTWQTASCSPFSAQSSRHGFGGKILFSCSCHFITRLSTLFPGQFVMDFASKRKTFQHFPILSLFGQVMVTWLGHQLLKILPDISVQSSACLKL